MKIELERDSQLNLNLLNRAAAQNCPSFSRRRQRRRDRAAVWFRHMRRVVDEAQDWPVSTATPNGF
jgi:hypothetical protein